MQHFIWLFSQKMFKICAFRVEKQEGPGNLDHSPESLWGGKNVTTKYNSHSPTLKSILGITQIITKAYQVTKFNQIILICSIQCLTFLPHPKARGVHKLHNVMRTMTFRKTEWFYLLSQYRSQWCVKGQNICMHGVKCFILINLIMQHDYFQKRKQISL